LKYWKVGNRETSFYSFSSFSLPLITKYTQTTNKVKTNMQTKNKQEQNK